MIKLRKSAMLMVSDVLDKLESVGLKLNAPISFEEMSSKNAYGKCITTTEKGKVLRATIKINSIVLSEASDKFIEETIAHELLHAIYPDCGHKGAWKYYADKVSKLFGYNIKRTTSSVDAGVVLAKNGENSGYKIVCSSCGNTFYRQKYTKVLKNIDMYRCACCNGSLHVE